MAKNGGNEANLGIEADLWRSADALRGQVDAAEYKHVVLGLLFLKYISDAFEARRDELAAELEADGTTGEQLDRLLENRDEYTAERVFWVPPEARWANLQNQAARPDIAALIDDAILAVERDNPNLKSKLPRDYARRGIEPVKLQGLIDLIANTTDISIFGQEPNPTTWRLAHMNLAIRSIEAKFGQECTDGFHSNLLAQYVLTKCASNEAHRSTLLTLEEVVCLTGH